MARLRDLKRRMKSVKNTAKITRTMELIATTKSKQSQARISKALPYFEALAEIAAQARKAGDQGAVHPLLAQREVKKVAILAVTANRGLCGGYNSNVIRLVRDRVAEHTRQGRQIRLFVSGKKGIAWAKFMKAPVEGAYTQFDDRPKFADVEMVADTLAGLFTAGEVDQVEVVYTHYYSAGRQAPVVETMLPISPDSAQAPPVTGKAAAPATKQKQVEFVIEPDPATILAAIFPLQARLHLFRVYLEAATSEQIYRRIAMKNATDNALDVSKSLRMDYNRARQSQITKEILEVLGGAEALA